MCYRTYKEDIKREHSPVSCFEFRICRFADSKQLLSTKWSEPLDEIPVYTETLCGMPPVRKQLFKIPDLQYPVVLNRSRPVH